MTTTSGFAQVATGLQWTREFDTLDAHAPVLDVLDRIRQSAQSWFLVVREGGQHLYVFSRAELLALLEPQTKAKLSLETALGLHEHEGSQKARAGEPLAVAEQAGQLPSRARFVEIDAQGQPVAVGGADVTAAPRRMRGRAPAAPAASAPVEEPRLGGGIGSGTLHVRRAAPAKSLSRSRMSRPPAVAAQPTPAAPLDDEGTTPVRHPSIEADGPLRPGKPVTLTVDLLLQPSATTTGGALNLDALPAAWNTLPLVVTLVSAGITFANEGRAEITIQRNRASVAAKVQGTVLATLKAGDTVAVHAQFWQGTRCCGSGVCSNLTVAAAPRRGAAAAPQAQPMTGGIAVDPEAAEPDFTVYITLFDPDQPTRMHWRLVTPYFDALPAKLTGIINLGADPKREAAALFKEFAVLKRGQHRQRIEGFGERLWKRAPPEFHAAYWALIDHYKRPLAIQFVSDDAHLPWELMRPSRPGETHEPMALRHAVARWIGAYQGWLRNRLPAGEMLVMAPRYSQLAAKLTKAEDTAKQVLDNAGAKGYVARPVAGTREALLALLEQPPAAPVAMLYFTGHGLFNDQAPSASAIKLEKGESLAADEVDREEIVLGTRDGTVVFFNACEVGATAGAIGEVGGWAGALLARRFRAFIAPLWAVDEEDASQATLELIEQIVVQRLPIGAALRDLRKKHGAVSPTFYSYILYGDVTARFGA